MMLCMVGYRSVDPLIYCGCGVWLVLFLPIAS